MTKEQEILDFLHARVFDHITESANASTTLKQGVRLTIMRLEQQSAVDMVNYYRSAMIGTDRSSEFARLMRNEGFTRFEQVIDEFRDRFNDEWLSAGLKI